MHRPRDFTVVAIGAFAGGLNTLNSVFDALVPDTAKAFDAESVMNGSKTAGGLLNLQHRLNLMGYSLRVKSRPNAKGTQVMIDIPIDKRV